MKLGRGGAAFLLSTKTQAKRQEPCAALGLPQGIAAGEALSRRSDHATSDLALAQPGILARVQGWGGYVCTCKACCTVVVMAVEWCGVVWCGWAEGV